MRRLLVLAWAVLLAACGDGGQAPSTAASAAASAPGMSSAASAILNTPQEADVLSAARQAMASASASDWPEYSAPPVPLTIPAASAASAVQAAGLSLPAVCEAYFNRADACFAAQGEDAALLQALNRDARNELAAAASAPSDADCQALNSSFHAVAANLGCR